MSRIAPLARADLVAQEPIFGAYEQIMGLVPNTVFTMARVPGLIEGYVGLAHAAAMNGLISEELAQLVGNVAERGGGLPVLPGAHGRARRPPRGGPGEAGRAVVVRDERPLLRRRARRAAARVARGAVAQRRDRRDFAECRRFYTDDQITAIVAVCALFGFLNRWNDTMATTLEPRARDVADRVLAPQGWSIGVHA